MKYNIELTQQELQVIYAALGELPLKMTINLFSKLQQAQQKQDAENAMPISELQRQAQPHFDEGNALDHDLSQAITGN
jgi:hypothetical protein